MAMYRFISAILLVAYRVQTLLACPVIPRCNCVEKEFRCIGANFTNIPDNLPVWITVLNIQYAGVQTIERDKITHLEKLEKFVLDHNSVSEIQDGAFDNHETLREISLKSNNLEMLRSGIFAKLKLLKTLILSDNLLTSIDGVFDGLMSLEILNLDNNQVQNVSAETFKDLHNLHHLELNNNKLQGIHADTFLHNKNLMLLGLGSNPITSIDNVLGKDMKLHYLNMTDCQLLRFPQGLPVLLTYLKLSKNNITGIYKADTEPYKHLTTLIIEENNLEFVEKGAFLPMKGLENVFLFVNNLHVVPGPFPRSVKNIYLDNNKIQSISSDSFEDGTELNMLSLRTNHIVSLSATSFQNIKSIQELHLEGNPIAVLDNNLFLIVTGLHYLTLNRLSLMVIFPDCFLGLDSLNKLEMSHVNIQTERIMGNIFKNTPMLEILELQNSPELARYILTSSEVLKTLENLKEISLKDNRLITLNDTFMKQLPNLMKINLAGNNFHCDSRLLWLRQWHDIEPQKFYLFNEVRCHKPHHLQGQRLKTIDISEFFKGRADSQTDSTYTVNTQEIASTTETAQTTLEVDYFTDYDHYSDLYPDTYDNYNYLSLTTIRIMEPTKISPEVTAEESSTTGEIHNTVVENNDNRKQKKHQIPDDSLNLKAVGIAIGMSFAVIVVMMLVAVVVYMFWNRKKNVVYHSARQYQGKDDYVFVVSKTETMVEPKRHRKLTREERGSTTSRASEDITNQADFPMKVYTLDVDA